MSRLLACALLAVLAPTLAVAQAPASNNASPILNEPDRPLSLQDAISITSPIVIAPDRPLSLEEAIALALQKSFGLQIQALTVENAKENLEIQDATSFDPVLTAGIGRSISQAATNTSRLDGTQTAGLRNDNTTANFAVVDRIPITNGTLRLAANVSRGANNNTNTIINPAYGNGVSATLNQPLLRDFGRQAAHAALMQAQLSLNIANLSYKSAVMGVIANVETAYYTLVTAREARRIRQLTFDASQRLLDETSARRASGVATDIDVLSNEVQVANNRRALVQSDQTVSNAEERLLVLFNVPSFDVRPGMPGLVAFQPYTGGAPNFAQSYKLARDFYPDGLSTEESIKQAELNLSVARRNTLPDVDLQATLGYAARQTNDGYLQAIQNLPKDHGNNWAINLNYNLPWGMRADKARYRQAENNLRSQKVRLEQLEQQLVADVRSAIRAVETNLVAADISAKTTELAARQYDQQKARYDAGLNTARLLQLSQDDLETARFNELSAQLQLRQADAELRRLEGTSLQRFKVLQQ